MAFVCGSSLYSRQGYAIDLVCGVKGRIVSRLKNVVKANSIVSYIHLYTIG